MNGADGILFKKSLQGLNHIKTRGHLQRHHVKNREGTEEKNHLSRQAHPELLRLFYHPQKDHSRALFVKRSVRVAYRLKPRVNNKMEFSLKILENKFFDFLEHFLRRPFSPKVNIKISLEFIGKHNLPKFQKIYTKYINVHLRDSVESLEEKQPLVGISRLPDYPKI